MPTEATTRSPLTVLSEEETMFRDSVRDFVGDAIAPLARSMEEAGMFDREMLEKLFQMGLMGIHVPEDLGGAGGTFFQSILAVEEISRVDAAVAVMVDVQNTLFNSALIRWGTKEQKKTFLPRATSDTVTAYALSEAGSGSDAFGLACRATSHGDHWILDGQKLWVSNAAEAGLFLIFATNDPSKGYKGITAFIVDRDDPGLAVGKREEKLGIKASSTCELILDQCKIPSDRVLGEVGKGYKIAIETLNEGRIGIGAQMVGVSTAALGEARSYSLERKQFGKPISEFQSVRFLLAECATRLEAARLLVYNAARLRDAGESFTKEAAMAKLYSSTAAEYICSKAIDVHGGYGYTSEYPVERYYRDCKIGQIYEGTSNMQLHTIAKQILRD